MEGSLTEGKVTHRISLIIGFDHVGQFLNNYDEVELLIEKKYEGLRFGMKNGGEELPIFVVLALAFFRVFSR